MLILKHLQEALRNHKIQLLQMHGPKSWHQLQAPTNDYHVPPNLCNHCNLKRSGHFFWLPSFASNELPELALVLSDIHHKTWGAMTGKQEIARKVTGTQPKSTEGPIGLDTVKVPSTQQKKIGSWWIKLVHFRISAIRKNAGFLQDQSTSVVHTCFLQSVFLVAFSWYLLRCS